MELTSPASDTVTLRGHFADVDPTALFGWWTEPNRLARFWADEASVEPVPGGRYTLSWPGPGWTLRGTYLAFEPGVRLSFTWRFDHEADRPERTVAMSFAAEDGGTALTVTHGRYASGDEEERQGHIEGWVYFCDRLRDALVED